MPGALPPAEPPAPPAHPIASPPAPQLTPPPAGWEHITLYQAVRDAILALPAYFTTELNIVGVPVADLHTFNTSLGATIESQAVETLPLYGIPLSAWRRFFALFSEERAEDEIRRGLERLVAEAERTKGTLPESTVEQVWEHIMRIGDLLAKPANAPPVPSRRSKGSAP